ncbi:TOPLESS [Heracleum sosnowskyi]|uniref:TOPLESS n=1 Tax=Heracleum sosnowskyi TaxID=360622 RepID=A0AAD8H0I0_9APIA|nr:TOPLESS [Heracleum sosnowskyi]
MSREREVVFLIRQFLEELKFKNTIRWLATDSGHYFDTNYFEDVVTNGELDEVEKYLSAFTKYDDNAHSLEMFFVIKKQKYLEALDKPDYGKAVEILRKEFTVFSTTHDELLNEMTLLLRLPNFRDNAALSKYGDTKQARSNLLGKLKTFIKKNPLFQDKIQFPNMENSRLRKLINQSLNWQHHLCKNPKHDPDFPTLFVNHSCGQVYGARAPCGLTFQHSLAIASRLKHPSSTNPEMVYHAADSETVQKRARLSGSLDEVNNPPQTSYSSDELPKTLVAILVYNSPVKSMDFHPVQQSFLLAGTNTGDVVLWQVGNKNMHSSQNFKVYNLGSCSASLQASLAKDPTASVNRVVWNSDGTLFGVAYSKNIAHIYSYHGGIDFRLRLQIDAHVGYVSDLSFSYPNKQTCIITCGEDKAIRVWDAVTGAIQYTFEGHEAPVYSVCPHYKEHTQYIISNSVDGKIKAWLYDNKGPRVHADAPGQSCTRMAYSADGTRFFSCGTNKDGESHLVEWDVPEGQIKRSYVGLRKRAMDVVQFDTTKNRFLAAGDEFVIKFWDTEDVNVLTTTNADGGLLASPCIRFSKDGGLLAVSASNNSVKILGNPEGSRLVNTVQSQTRDPSRSPLIGAHGASGVSAATELGALEKDARVSVIAPLTGDCRTSALVNRRMTGEIENSRILKPEEISKQSQLRCLRLPDTLLSAQITRLIYTYSGGAILALASNGIHKLWRWPKNEQNWDGKATVNVLPELWQPSSGKIMTNDFSETKPEDAVPCLALTNNDHYVMSGSGGRISLFNMETFEAMRKCMPPPPAATFLALYPQDNNIVALGMEDSSIQIYDTRTDEVIGKLEGHQDRVTGLAFSIVLKALVSSGAEGQICVWSMDGWNKQASKFVHIPSGQAPNTHGQHRVQFHQDQTHLLVFHENLIAVYEAPELKCIKQWCPGKSNGSITDARYSCDSQSVYASFESGIIVVFTAALIVKCQISPQAYLTASPSTRMYPLVIAAHPNEPHQFALGLSDGSVQCPSDEGNSYETKPAPMKTKPAPETRLPSDC